MLCSTLGEQIFGLGCLDMNTELMFPLKIKRVTLIECKYWSKPVTPEAVLTLQGRLDDIRPTLDLEVEGMMVTNRFVGPGAKQLAQRFGIRCSVVKSPDEAWLFWYAGNATIQPNPVPLIIGINPPTIITSDPNEDENI
jgi:hypothetical protein